VKSRRWTDLHRFVDEVSDARIWVSTTGSRPAWARDMSRRIGEYVVNNVLLPLAVATR
jgi:hypothetical protein